MDFNTIPAQEFGHSLSGLSVNLLVRDVLAEVAFLADVFDMQAHRSNRDFAIMVYAGQVFQLHADHTYANHPLPSLVPESGPRGGGSSFVYTKPTPIWPLCGRRVSPIRSFCKPRATRRRMACVRR